MTNDGKDLSDSDHERIIQFCYHNWDDRLGKLKRGQVEVAAAKYNVHRNTIGKHVALVKAKKQGLVASPVKVTNRKKFNARPSHANVRQNLYDTMEEACRTFEDVAQDVSERGETTVSSSTVSRDYENKMFKRIRCTAKPMLSDAHRIKRLKHALSMIDPLTLKFKSLHNIVFLDEKWFFLGKPTTHFYVSNSTESSTKPITSKNNSEKLMFLAAVSRPRFAADGSVQFDGKLGIWPFSMETRELGVQ